MDFNKKCRSCARASKVHRNMELARKETARERAWLRAGDKHISRLKREIKEAEARIRLADRSFARRIRWVDIGIEMVNRRMRVHARCRVCGQLMGDGHTEWRKADRCEWCEDHDLNTQTVNVGAM